MRNANEVLWDDAEARTRGYAKCNADREEPVTSYVLFNKESGRWFWGNALNAGILTTSEERYAKRFSSMTEAVMFGIALWGLEGYEAVPVEAK